MPVGMKGAPECSAPACYKKIYRCGEQGNPLCVSHYRERYDEQLGDFESPGRKNTKTDNAGKEDR